VPGGGGHGAANLAKSRADRHATAKKAVGYLGLTLPTLVDGLYDAVNHAYGAWPDRLYIVAPDGTIAFAGAPGPKGFDPDEVEAKLKSMVTAAPADDADDADEAVQSPPPEGS